MMVRSIRGELDGKLTQVRENSEEMHRRHRGGEKKIET